jgi:hypothetical protein
MVNMPLASEKLHFAAYSVDVACANLNDLLGVALDTLSERQPGDDSTEGLAASLSISEPSHELIETDEAASRLLAQRDLEMIGNYLADHRDEVDDYLRNHDLRASLAEAESLLASRGLHVSPVTFDVVDRFPDPYGDRQWSAFCPDEGDKKKYGIEPGIYLLRSAIRPFYTELLLGHELVHVVPGRVSPDILAPGLEEGLAELLGTLIVGRDLVGESRARRVFLHGRYSVPMFPLWQLYLDQARRAYSYMRFQGVAGCVSLLESGRNCIRDVESRIPTIASHVDVNVEGEADLVTYLDSCLLTPLSGMVLTALEFLVFEQVAEGRSVADIAARSGVSATTVGGVLDQLASKTGSFTVSGGNVMVSNAHLYLGGMGRARYAISTAP